MAAARKGTPRPNAGRPLKFKSAKELQDKIDEYFDYCDNRIRSTVDSNGNEKTYTWPEPYTISKLAVWLGTNRQTLINYAERDEYFDTIKMAKAKVEADIEVRTIEARQPAGAIFVLKNGFGWVDESRSKIEADINSKTELSEDALAVLAKATRTDGSTQSE